MKVLKTCAVMALVVLVSVFALNLHTLAATWNGETVYYTVINDEMLELSYNSMPASRSGTVYVPYSLFVDYFDVKSS